MTLKSAKSIGAARISKSEAAALKAENVGLSERIDDLTTEIAELRRALAEKKLSDENKITDESESEKSRSGNDRSDEAQKKKLTDEAIEEKIKRADEKIAADYASEIRRLYVFASRWQAALPTDERFPDNERRKAVAKAIREIICDNAAINSAEQGKDLLARITAAMNGGAGKKESDVFDLDEVLNPGELDLESLCKELGVMD